MGYNSFADIRGLSSFV